MHRRGRRQPGDAEGEIRTPEGLAAHQISSLARWTELRYLSASPSSAVRNTFSRPLSGSIDERRVVRSSFSGFRIWTRSGVSKASFVDATVSDMTSWYP